MTRLQMQELHKLPTTDKIKIVQDLWDDIANENSLRTISAEHKKILDERIEKIASGQMAFKPWLEVQKKYTK
jgi:putative addiction module component (TIGR02574 family)